jgi:hypothetical protein
LHYKCYHANLKAVEDTLGVVSDIWRPSMRIPTPKFVDNMHKKKIPSRRAAAPGNYRTGGAGSAAAKSVTVIRRRKLTSNDSRTKLKWFLVVLNLEVFKQLRFRNQFIMKNTEGELVEQIKYS